MPIQDIEIPFTHEVSTGYECETSATALTITPIEDTDYNCFWLKAKHEVNKGGIKKRNEVRVFLTEETAVRLRDFLILHTS